VIGLIIGCLVDVVAVVTIELEMIGLETKVHFLFQLQSAVRTYIL
jgi:hypothetical protein